VVGQTGGDLARTDPSGYKSQKILCFTNLYSGTLSELDNQEQRFCIAPYTAEI